VCDGQADGQTDILPRHCPSYAYSSRSKKYLVCFKPIIVPCLFSILNTARGAGFAVDSLALLILVLFLTCLRYAWYTCTGDMDSGRGEREADRGGEGTARGHGVRPEPRPARGSSHHGVRQSSVLRPYRGRLHDRPADARHPADAVRLRTRLHPAPTEQHQFKAAAPMGCSDRQRKWCP